MVEPQRSKTATYRLAVLTVSTSVVIVVAYCLWALDRGFELTDESYYVLLGMYPDASRFYISGQQWVLSWFWQLAQGLTAFRATGLAILVVSAIVLASGIIASARRLEILGSSRGSRRAIIGSSILCALLYATTINLSPSYNLLAAAGAYLAAGLVLLTSGDARRPAAHLALLFAGAALGVEVICKASAGAASFAVIAFWIVLFGGLMRHKLVDLAMVILGLAAMIAIALLLNTRIDDAIAAMTEGMTLFRMVQMEPVHVRLLRYAAELLQFITTTLMVFGAPILLLVLFRASGRAFFAVLALVLFAGALLFATLDGVQFSLEGLGAFLLGGTGRFASQMTLAFAVTLSALVVAFPLWCTTLKRAGLTFGLLLLPYSVAVGSGNSLTTQIVDSLAPWGGLVALLAFTPLSRPASHLIVAILAIVTASHIVSSSLAPYNMVSPLSEQSESVELNGLGNLKLDAATKAFVRDLQAAAASCAIAPGSPILGLYNVPGVALLLEAVPLSTPWLNNKEQADFVLKDMPAADLEGLVVAINRVYGQVVPLMPDRLAAFPEGFTACGSGIYPFNNQTIEIWRAERP